MTRRIKINSMSAGEWYEGDVDHEEEVGNDKEVLEPFDLLSVDLEVFSQ